MKRATFAVYAVLILATMVWAHGDEQHVNGDGHQDRLNVY
jgi:hypothetical protein